MRSARAELDVFLLEGTSKTRKSLKFFPRKSSLPSPSDLADIEQTVKSQIWTTHRRICGISSTFRWPSLTDSEAEEVQQAMEDTRSTEHARLDQLFEQITDLEDASFGVRKASRSSQRLFQLKHIRALYRNAFR